MTYKKIPRIYIFLNEKLRSKGAIVVPIIVIGPLTQNVKPVQVEAQMLKYVKSCFV